MTTTTKCTRRLMQKLVCVWALVLSTHQVAQATSTKKVKSSKKNSNKKSAKSAPSAVFTMMNLKGGNEIIMYERNKRKGKLKFTGSPFSTGGVGMNFGNPVNPLGSKNPLVVADNCLLAVNAGSDTLTSFQILINDGVNEPLKRVSIVSSGGEIPVSITYSSVPRFVYALNAGKSGSVRGFTLGDDCVLTPIPDSIRDLNQDTNNEVTGWDVVWSSPAQIGFSPNGQQLLVTIKGIDGDNASGGIIYYSDVDGDTGLLSNPRTFETRENGIVPFGFDFDGDDNLIVVNAFGSGKFRDFNAGSVTLYNFEGNNNAISLVQNTLIGQSAVSGIKYSNGCAFTTNNWSSSISSLSVINGEMTLVKGSATEENVHRPADEIFSPDGKYLYVLVMGGLKCIEPEIHVYGVSSDDDCGLSKVQVIDDGLSQVNFNDFGVLGMAVF